MRSKNQPTNDSMAIVKATYTKSRPGAKAALRYIQHRPGREGEKVKRELFGIDGVMERQQAYRMIDDAEKGSVFFRLVISPDPATEDTEKDLRLNEITAQAMTYLEEHLQKAVLYVAAEHDDHAPHRHVHIIAMVKGRLNTQDFQALRQTATEAALLQRQERDQAREQQQQQQEGAQWAA
jgi:hypothetical protein